MSRILSTGLAAALAVLVSACSSTPAPVEDLSAPMAGDYGLTPDGLYRVRRGDTLYSIAFRYSLDWKDVARWNDVNRPFTIFPGQELRLTAPAPARTGTATTTTRAAGTAPRATTRPADLPPPRSGTSENTTESPEPAANASVDSSAVATTPPPASAPPPPATAGEPLPVGPLRDPDRWLWPTEGRLLSRFSPGDPARKGIDIAGEEGQAIVASAAGDVVYSGNGLIGFGELIIIKHSDSMLTAYAHNRRRLVEEGERVAAGSRIAEMGRNDQDTTMLHFELRVDGKPVDPLRYLPAR